MKKFKFQNQIFGGKFRKRKRTNLRTPYNTIDYVPTSFSLVQRMNFLFPNFKKEKQKEQRKTKQKQHHTLSIY